MILCLVGTNPYDFSRLVKKLDEVSPQLNMPVIVQIGYTKYKPINCEHFSFKPKEEVKKLMQKAELIVTQGGFGSMTDAIMMHKRLIAVPRLIELKESQDNQVELVEYFESKGYLKACYNIEEFEGIIKHTLENKFTFKKYKRETNIKVSKIIKTFFNEI